MNLELKTCTELCQRIGIKKTKMVRIPRECAGTADR
jgi:hypothetical protein